MRILYLGGFELPNKNAAALRVMSNAKLLREMGFQVSFIGVSKDIDNAPKDVDGFDSNPIPYPDNARQWVRLVLTFISKDDIKSYSPDYVVLYNFPAIASLKILHYCHKSGIKVIQDLTEWEQTEGYSPRDVLKRFDTQLRMRYCIKKMDGVIAISQYLYNFYKDFTKTILMPPTVDLLDEKWKRERTLEANSPITLVYAGNPGAKSKDRLDYIVEAVSQFPNMQLNVVGITREQYEEGYGSIDASIKNVHFLGKLPHKDAVEAVCDADFQMLIRDNTLKNTAGFPTKFVESFSCGTPVIATLTSNVGDYLKDGVNGFVVDDNNTIDIVLNKISNMPEKAIIKMKQACQKFDKFDYRYYKREFEIIFN